TLGQYLQADNAPAGAFTADQLAMPGWKFEIQTTLKGYGGKHLHLQGSVWNASTRAIDPGSTGPVPAHYFVPPGVPAYQGLQWAWAAKPVAPGTYFIKLQLYDMANKPLAFYDSNAEPGNRMTLECGAGCTFKGPS